MRGIKDKVAVVTGGAGGIGAAICHRFGEEGTIVAVYDIYPVHHETRFAVFLDGHVGAICDSDVGYEDL